MAFEKNLKKKQEDNYSAGLLKCYNSGIITETKWYKTSILSKLQKSGCGARRGSEETFQ